MFDGTLLLSGESFGLSPFVLDRVKIGGIRRQLLKDVSFLLEENL